MKRIHAAKSKHVHMLKIELVYATARELFAILLYV